MECGAALPSCSAGADGVVRELEEELVRTIACYTMIGMVGLAALTACQMSNANSPPLRSGAKSLVTIAWSADDEESGALTATLPDGRVFRGPYLRIARSMPPSRLDPLLEGWATPWNFWVYWERPYAIAFANYYHGRLLANLKAEAGDRLRCNFALARASKTPTGGERGVCQFADGRLVEAAFRVQ